MSPRLKAVVSGLASAVLFGASAPLAKLLLPATHPLLLAGLFYLGAGAGLSAYRLLARRATSAPLMLADGPLLAGIVLAGGIAGPVLLLVGLSRVSGLAGALLLNLEAVFTVLLAVAVFGERLGRREFLAAGLVVLGGGLLVLGPREAAGSFAATGWGTLAIAGACLCWALDNNLTQKLSHKDPTAVVRFKTLVAGSFTLAVALATGGRLPSGPLLMASLAVGAVCYGVSLVLALYALRHLGAAREAALFAVAPFAGALLSMPLLGQWPTALDGLAGAVMAAGVALLVSAGHGHRHRHPRQQHSHPHVHDAHHQHAHLGPAAEPHSHEHAHDEMEHDHPHGDDVHHRHGHG